MARWLLTAPHYLKCSGDNAGVYEHKETDRFTGKQITKKFPVGVHLNTKDDGDFNYTEKSPDPHTQEVGIIVARPGKGLPRDILFECDVTPDMRPLDDEARKISEETGARLGWKVGQSDFFREGNEHSYADRMLDDLQGQVAEALSRGGNTEANSAVLSELKDAVSMLAQIMAQNATLMAKLAEPTARRV